jgi:4-alpha-glucanotransferase
VAPTNRFTSGRHAGVLLPLFSAPSCQSWGIGELSDLPLLCGWLKTAGLDLLQVLPLNEMAWPDFSPYSALSAMAIDPIFVSLRDVPEFQASGGEDALRTDRRRLLTHVRQSSRIHYDSVRTLKMAALRTAFARFHETEWIGQTRRARELGEFRDREREWLNDYTLFRALHERFHARAWWEWSPALARRDPQTIERAREEFAEPCLFYSYVQWLADSQWQEARRAVPSVGVFGDLSFMVGADSADVWTHQQEFRTDATVGAPPDEFNETGQDWRLPVYQWDVIAAENDGWIRARARRNAALFDGFRIDHVVGFYRTYVIPGDGCAPGFTPPDEPDQLAQGERVMRAFCEAGARLIAEDLGTVPDFVRASLSRLEIPGYKVLRWEREWTAPGQPFRNPKTYPRKSVATTGTHDTETLVEWWESASIEERSAAAEIPCLAGRLRAARTRCDAATRDALLEAVVASSSDFLILPFQDVFGWRDRINLPGTVSDDNWVWRLPWPVDRLHDEPEARDRAATLAGWMRTHQRCGSEK